MRRICLPPGPDIVAPGLAPASVDVPADVDGDGVGDGSVCRPRIAFSRGASERGVCPGNAAPRPVRVPGGTGVAAAASRGLADRLGLAPAAGETTAVAVGELIGEGAGVALAGG